MMERRCATETHSQDRTQQQKLLPHICILRAALTTLSAPNSSEDLRTSLQDEARAHIKLEITSSYCKASDRCVAIRDCNGETIVG
ncbi:hypothetical protein EVAR_73258_1, partial [Eumeta japonica]